MPELPDVEVYRESLERHLVGAELQGTRLASPFLLRTVEPSLDAAAGRTVGSVGRLGKRLALGLTGDLYLVLHLMVAGRLRWRKAGASERGRGTLAVFDFAHGALVLTEASKKKRASLFVVAGAAGLAEHDRGGLDLRQASPEEFATRLRSESRTLKRALCDPRLFDGVGNAYSDEILHHARLSPFLRTADLSDERVRTLHASAAEVLNEWTERLRAEVGDGFPDKVTAFRDEMAVHGKFGQSCPVCEPPVQRVVHAENETNYCPGCQTAGRILADRALSKLLKDDWPKSLDEL